VEKISTYLTGDPNLLLAGETLRYTITVENIGTDDATGVTLRDAVPVNTTYVAGSTMLGGAAVPDSAGGIAPLSGGIQINAPSDPTPGVMPADDTLGPNVATLTFDVVVDPDVIDGSVISNQAFVSAVSGGVVDQPSDDPTTAIPDDPTRDVVGNAPLLFAPKSTVIGVDGGSPGIVDPLDVLHYTITVYNNGAVPATAATLIDGVPANTTWVADSLTLNGLPLGVPDGGVSPLATGIALQSSDLTPPLPGPGGGTLSPGETAVIEFDLQVDAGTPDGTLITNQAVVGSAELANLLTDGDGNPATGPEPTIVVVGAGQQLVISKQMTVVGGGAALAGGELEYEVRITNVATVTAQTVVITDDLDAPVAGQLHYVAGSATLDGLPAGVVLLGSVLTADYSALYGPLQPGASAVLRFRAGIDAGLPIATTITNTGVVTWNTPTQTASASVSIDVGGMPGVGLLNGRIWHDQDFDNALGGSELTLQGWTVELLRSGTSVQTVLTDAAGLWAMGGLTPNDLTGDQYALRFRGPGAGANSASLGLADSVFTNELQEIEDLIVASGSNLLDLNLPIDPNGVVYGALGRTPVEGTTLTLLAAGTGTALPSGCFDDPVQQGQVTRSDGYYKFDLNFSDAACPSGAGYTIALTAPSDFEDGQSAIIPAQSDGSTPPFSVPTCPGSAADEVAATAQYCEVQASALAPSLSVPARAPETDYQTHLVLDASATPGSSQLFNNHIPLDPVIAGNIAITKTTPLRDVSRGDLVPYEITVRNELAAPIPDLTIVDRFPAGFRYIEGSARVDGVPTEPLLDATGHELIWTDVGIDATSNRSVVLLLAVGAGVSDGKFSNRAQAMSSLTGSALSGEATATVRVVPDPTFACTDVLGKVFDDANRDGTQDRGERGLPGVRLVTARGLVATTDPYGRFHITCAVIPNEERGSNFILKLDDRSLPAGYRMSTRAAQVKRATAGKALRFNYGASIHRVVGLDLADAVFEPGTTTIREQWTPRLELLLDELAESASTLRLSYVGDVEAAGLVDRRIASVKQEVARRWKQRDGGELTIETKVYWRRGAPAGRSLLRSLDGGLLSALTAPFRAATTRDVDAGDATEQQLPPDAFTPWTQDPERLATDLGDRIEERTVVVEQAEIVKLTSVVPPIHFESGVADIPARSVEELRDVLESMHGLSNVRVHLVGHADDEPLSASLAAVYGDNEGLSHERAGEVAEYLQAALALAPEAISFAYAGADEPVADNATQAGRARNRRVEVEVWYDEKRDAFAAEEIVVAADIKRVKVCRTETVCKLRYREGHERRARIRNLIAPLHIAEDIAAVPDDFVRRVRQALDNLRDKNKVAVKLIGYTDDAPLEGRAARIYGTHLALSKARAHRVARAIQDRLELPTAAVASDGRGTASPLASNDTERGQALNRRIEVEFWYDDPLQELPDELQMCPDPGDAELVTKVYDPPWGRLEPIPIEDGQARIPAGYANALRRAMDDVANEENVRLRFVGYTRNERLDRRTAGVYGDDIGLSAARARRTMEQLRGELDLSEAQTEHEGRGFVHSNDVVNGGFLQGDTDHVAVQVIYDEPAMLDGLDGIDVTPITRDLRTKDPLALNLMHITVDGEPIDDPGRSSADIQRCTDVALERADIRFKFDDLEATPRLSVTSHAGAVSIPASALSSRSGEAEGVVGIPGTSTTATGSSVDFRMYTNYEHFIERSEVRIFEQGQSLQAEPLAVVEVEPGGAARWKPDPEHFASPVRELVFVLRSYDAEGRFDQTAPQALWLVHGTPNGGAAGKAQDGVPTAPDPLLAGYGESGPLHRSIPLGGAGSVQVHGSGVPPNHTVWLAGTPVPVDEHGNFVAEALLPTGLHTVEVAVLDAGGNGELFLRDLELERNDWFYVGIADVTIAAGKTSGPDDVLQGQDSTFDRDSTADGRLAFFVKGRFGDDWRLTAHADTREGPVKDLFKDFVDKTPEALFRRIDSDRLYPTFGDEGTVEESAPTSGKFFVKLSKRENHAMWGNFKVGYLDNELAHVDRGLYGANAHYQSLTTTGFGEQRLELDGFAAQPGTMPSRDEFRGTGGSLYYLRVQDLLEGSERLRIEVRDKDSGLVTGVVHLRPTLDYDIDYLQGRVLLSEPLSATASDNQLVHSQGLSGDEVWLVVQYEYTPGFAELDGLATGGQGHFWLNDFIRVGATANRNDNKGADSSLYAGDLTMRRSSESWLKLQYGRSEGLVSTTLRSDDGGFNFLGTNTLALSDAAADGYRADLSIGFADLLPAGMGRGRLSAYVQMLEAGYSAPGLTAVSDTQQYGGLLDMPITGRLQLDAKADHRVEDRGLETTAAEVDLAFQLTEGWRVSTGVRHERRDDDLPLVPLTQEQGNRTDAIAQLDYDSRGRWSAYGFGQGTLAKSGNRDDNNRYGLGGAYRVTDRLAIDGEVSHGDLGPALKLGTSFQESEQTHRYLSYALENERGIDGLHSRRGNLISGARTRLSDSSSVYLEDRYQHSDAQSGLSRAMGMTLALSERLSFAASGELGSLTDHGTQAETERRAGGATIGYRFDKVQLSTGVEYRDDETEQPDASTTQRTTWLFKNNLKFQMTPDWRLLGKFNHSFSNSSQGEFFDGGYTEAVLGFAYRPVKHDRLNALAKYTYFSNMPTTDQVTAQGTASQFIQRSHVAALDVSYDLTPSWSIGGKYAFRRGEVSLDRENPDFFDNSAHLYILRTDYRFLKDWELLAEGRLLDLPDLDERRAGALLTIYRHLGDHFKVGVGYNFTDFSEDLTDLSYDHHGIFFNLVGSL
ncbi:MAG: OmpA family protein, partial [Myxococcota bacterium]